MRRPRPDRRYDAPGPIPTLTDTPSPHAHLLIIDDNPAVATALEVLFSLHDIATLHAQTPEAGLAVLQRESVDLVIQDMNFTADTTSGEEGVALFAQIRARHPDLPVILLTAWTHLSSAVELVKAGAADYLAKPWDDRKLLATVNNLLELAEARSELDRRRNRERARQEQLARSTTCAAWCSPTRPANACSRSPARSRAPTCRC